MRRPRFFFGGGGMGARTADSVEEGLLVLLQHFEALLRHQTDELGRDQVGEPHSLGDGAGGHELGGMQWIGRRQSVG